MIADPLEYQVVDYPEPDWGAQAIDVDLILALDAYNEAIGEERSA